MLNTKRLTLRPIKPEDNIEVFNYRSDADANKYQGWVPKSLSEVDEFIRKNPDEFNLPDTWYQLVIIKNDSNEIIGDVGIHFLGDDNAQCEIGCTLDKNFQTNGFASEALSSVIDYLFNVLGKHRITTSIDPENISSIKLVNRLGFRKEAHFKQNIKISGIWKDDLVYAILKNEWEVKI